jgi:hypothetical protein
MNDLLHARDQLNQALHLAEGIYMAARSLDDDSDREAIRAVVYHLQPVLRDVGKTIAGL